MDLLDNGADLFAVLAACYAEPHSGLASRLDELLTADKLPADLLQSKVQELKSCYATTALNELKLDHARLFVGPFELVAPPFGSVYLEEKRTLMGESTQEAIEIYRQAGLDMAGDFNNPADHIVAELEFMAYLLSALPLADPETARELDEIKHRFLTRHLGAWIEPFTSKVEQGAETKFYKLLAGITCKAVRAGLK